MDEATAPVEAEVDNYHLPPPPHQNALRPMSSLKVSTVNHKYYNLMYTSKHSTYSVIYTDSFRVCLIIFNRCCCIYFSYILDPRLKKFCFC